MIGPRPEGYYCSPREIRGWIPMKRWEWDKIRDSGVLTSVVLPGYTKPKYITEEVEKKLLGVSGIVNGKSD